MYLCKVVQVLREMYFIALFHLDQLDRLVWIFCGLAAFVFH